MESVQREEDEHEEAIQRRADHRIFKGSGGGDAMRLHELESENARLKKLLAEALLDKEALQVVARGKR